ncbi:hypothetical protein T484DRAFT_1750564 [Baffinella frigidus]|nr:hypothetical protein T484DRAFT_1750564 [Cryptophyta sp. CCMP2293]
MLNAHVNAFDHMQYHKSVPLQGDEVKSTRIVAEVLGSFMEGLGHHVAEDYTFTYMNKLGLARDRGPMEQAKEDAGDMQAAFREKLVTQIHQLTGKKPRFQLVDQETHDWVIYEE